MVPSHKNLGQAVKMQGLHGWNWGMKLVGMGWMGWNRPIHLQALDHVTNWQGPGFRHAWRGRDAIVKRGVTPARWARVFLWNWGGWRSYHVAQQWGPWWYFRRTERTFLCVFVAEGRIEGTHGVSWSTLHANTTYNEGDAECWSRRRRRSRESGGEDSGIA